MQLKPKNDYVIVLNEDRKFEQDGFVVNEKEAEHPMQATVFAVGPKTTHTKVGERVWFEFYAGRKTRMDDKQITILREENIIAEVVDNG